jgi:hypothetical protein
MAMLNFGAIKYRVKYCMGKKILGIEDSVFHWHRWDKPHSIDGK